MITYGHEQFIQQAIESILKQQTSFSFELVIANDCSPDMTDKVVNNIIETYNNADSIRYYSHSTNKGMYANFIFALRECRGQYIALCEGDDYWTDPFKLQKQVDFLEANLDYEVCFTNIAIANENGVITKNALITDSRKSTYVRNNLPIWAPTLTRVFRNRSFSTVPAAPGLDTIMLLWQSQFGRIKFINEITGVYRKHHGGIYSSKEEGIRKAQIIDTHITSLSLLESDLYKKYFGMLFKKLTELRGIDQLLFNNYKNRIHQAFRIYHSKMTGSLRLKIRISFFLVALIPSRLNVSLLKFFNHIFIYKSK